MEHLPQTPPPSSKDNNAVNSNRTAVKFEIQPISDLINAFIYRKHACGRNRRGKRGYSGLTRCTRLWHTFDYPTPSIDRPTIENHCAYVPTEVITRTRKPASRMDPYPRRSWPCTDAHADSYIREPDPSGRWFGYWCWETLVGRFLTP